MTRYPVSFTYQDKKYEPDILFYRDKDPMVIEVVKLDCLDLQKGEVLIFSADKQNKKLIFTHELISDDGFSKAIVDIIETTAADHQIPLYN